MPVRRTGSPLHLDEGDDLVPFYDEVDLLTKESDVTVQNTPTPCQSDSFERALRSNDPGVRCSRYGPIGSCAVGRIWLHGTNLGIPGGGAMPETVSRW